MAEPNPQLVKLLKEMSTKELIFRRANLDEYANHTFWGHSQIRANLNAYDREIALRQA